MPEISKLVQKLINGYFNLTILKNLRLKVLDKKAFSSSNQKSYKNKIFLSKAQFKHTNDNVFITLFFYNREIKNYLYFNKIFLKKKKIKLFKLFRFLKKTRIKYNKKFLKIQKYIFFHLYSNNNFNLKFLKNIVKYRNLYYKNYIRLSLKIFFLQLYLIQLIFLNKSKFKSIFIKGLVYLLKKIYNKNIILNLINIKYFYLNNDILLQVLDLKIKKKRQNYLRFIKTIFKKIKISKKFLINSKFKLGFKDLNPEISLSDSYVNNLKSLNLKKNIFNTLKSKRITGIRLKAKGRLTRRHTASRSQSELKTKGSLINFNSLYGYSSNLLRNQQRSNLEFNKVYSHTRAGTFGLKG